MGLSPLLSGWWVLIVIGVVGLVLLSAAALYVLMQPTKSAVTLPPRAPMPVIQPPQMAAWSSHPETQPMTAPMPQFAAFTPAPPPFVSPDHTMPLAALTGDMLDNALIMMAPRVSPSISPISPPQQRERASAAPPSTSKPASSKAPLPLRPNATLVSATPPPMPRRTLPPPASRVPARPYQLAAMAPSKAAELLSLQLDSDLPPAMQTPHAPDTEKSLEDDDAPTMMTTWESMDSAEKPRRGSA